MKYLITITGISCSGKTTLREAMLQDNPNLYEKIIGTTTRPPREGELDGVDYHFISESEVCNSSFIESTTYMGYTYGTEATRLTDAFLRKKIPVVVCDPNGVKELSAYCDKHNVSHIAIVLSVKNSHHIRLVVDRLLKRYSLDLRSYRNRLSITNKLSKAFQEITWDVSMIQSLCADHLPRIVLDQPIAEGNFDFGLIDSYINSLHQDLL